MAAPEPPGSAAGEEEVAAAHEAVPEVGLAGAGRGRGGALRPREVGGEIRPWL